MLEIYFAYLFIATDNNDDRGDRPCRRRGDRRHRVTAKKSTTKSISTLLCTTIASLRLTDSA